MNEMVLYVAGKVSGLPDLNKPKFEAAVTTLRNRGYIVRNPHEICSGRHPDDWKGCMRDCIRVLMECDAVILLDDWWQESKGAYLEAKLAEKVGIRVFELDAFLQLTSDEIILTPEP